MAVNKPQPQQKPFRMQFLGLMAVISAFVIFMYATTFQPETVNVLISATVLGAIGFILGLLLVGMRVEPFDFRAFIESIIWTVVAVCVMWIVNRYSPFMLGVNILNVRWFSVLMAVAEECFFRILLCGLIFRGTHSIFLSATVSSGMWTIYHTARYGGDAGTMFIVFICGCVLGWVFLVSRLADGVIFGHAIVNFLATRRQTTMVTASMTGLHSNWLPEIHDLPTLGLWGLVVAIGLITVATIINHLMHKPYLRKPKGSRPKAPRQRLPSGKPKARKKTLTGKSKVRRKPRGKR